MNTIVFLTSSALFATIIFSGCTANLVDPEIAFEPPKYVEQMPSREEHQDFSSKGSLFGQGDNPLFSDHKAMHVNDIVTVTISETANSTSTASKNLSENDSSTLGGGVFSSAGGNAAVGGALNRVNGVGNIGFTNTSTSAYKGAGSATKASTFTTTLAARIIKVLQNGNYFISGTREILVDGQKQIVQLSGVIRPYDIDQYNKISSANISDARISYKTEGDVKRATEQGWGTKIVQAVWPF